ncbi:MAG: hypothetical protein ACE5IR_28615, partial [bacterium]
MMKKNKLIAAIHLFVSIAFFHCAPNVDLEQERQTLLKTDFEFAKASQEKGAVAAFYAYLDSNATLFPINADPVFGRQAIYTHMSTAPEVQLFWEPKLAEVA